MNFKNIVGISSVMLDSRLKEKYVIFSVIDKIYDELDCGFSEIFEYVEMKILKVVIKK